MIRYKRTGSISLNEIIPKLGEGFEFDSFSILNTGNICMIFRKRISENEIRYIIKIHTRVGLHRQCSFTAVDALMAEVFLYRGELYAFLSDAEGKVSLARLEPDTKEDIVVAESGEVCCFGAKNKDEFVLGYSDGRIIEYQKGKPVVLADEGKGTPVVTYDCNERLMWTDIRRGITVRRMHTSNEEFVIETDDIESFMISRDDRSSYVFKQGCIYELKREENTFRNPAKTDLNGEICRMNKSTFAILKDNVITVYTI